MYEKFGLMSNLKNPKAIEFLLERDETNRYLVEAALCRRFGMSLSGIAEREPRGRTKSREMRNALPVKVSNPRLIAALLRERRERGRCTRFTIEQALLKMQREEVAP